MVCRSCLNDPTAIVVADASVMINLNATGFTEATLNALPNRFVVTEEVAFELETDRRNGRNDWDVLCTLAAAGRIEIVRLGNAGIGCFTTLVSGPAAQTLDDGEAATIAYALEYSATALIDERKANRICAERFSALTTGCTVDLLAHDGIEATLGRDGTADAVFNALYHGRMRVLPRHIAWVVNLIGPERAIQCVSLPKAIRSTGASRAR